MALHKLLIVEDEDLLFELYRDLFHSLPVEILVAENGLKGLEMARTHLPKVMLLDLDLPQMKGMKVLEALHSEGLHKQINILINTSQTLADEEKAYAVTLGVQGFVEKPTNYADLMEKMGALLYS